MASTRGRTVTIDPELRARSNTGIAAFTGALLAVVGFFWFGGALETDLGLLLVGKTMFFFVLRVGGILLIAVAVWCSIGIPIALLMHAILANVIGVLLVTSAVLMISGGGFLIGSLLAAVCGVILITTGLRDLRDFRRLPLDGETQAPTEDVKNAPAFDEPLEESPLIDPRAAQTKRPSATKRRPSGSAGSTPNAFLSGLPDNEQRTER